MTAKSYLVRTLSIAVALALLVVGINLVVDPYCITGAPRISGFNQYKVEINEHVDLMKKYHPLQASHDTLLVGNSRIEMGINPSHRCFVEGNMDAYNLGVPGEDLRTQFAYALDLVYQQPISTVFLTIDFADFIGPEWRPLPIVPMLEEKDGMFLFTPSGGINPEYRWKRLLDYYKSLFSLDALTASIETVVGQAETAPDRDNAGFNPARDFAEAVRTAGPRDLFEQKMSELRAKYSNIWYFRRADQRLGPTLEDLDAFLEVLVKRGVVVYVFTNPFHQSYWEMLQAQGYMPLYEEWLESAKSILKQYEGDGVRFWNFSGDSAYIHEVVPPRGVKSGPLHWFWEPSHYRRQLGNLMIEAMLADSCGTQAAFGTRLQ